MLDAMVVLAPAALLPAPEFVEVWKRDFVRNGAIEAALWAT